MHRLEQYSSHKCIETESIVSSIVDGLLEEHALLIFEKLGVVLEVINIVAT